MYSLKNKMRKRRCCYIMVNPKKMGSSQNGFGSSELFLHGKTNINLNTNKTIVYYYFLYHSVCVTRSLNDTFVELFKPPFCDATVAKSTVLWQH